MCSLNKGTPKSFLLYTLAVIPPPGRRGYTKAFKPLIPHLIEGAFWLWKQLRVSCLALNLSSYTSASRNVLRSCTGSAIPVSVGNADFILHLTYLCPGHIKMPPTVYNCSERDKCAYYWNKSNLYLAKSTFMSRLSATFVLFLHSRLLFLFLAFASHIHLYFSHVKHLLFLLNIIDISCLNV